jgi:hypothetical protein
MGDEKRSYCTILDEVAKDKDLADFVETIHHACMSSVLSSRRRVLLIPPAKERKAIAAKKGEGLADELRKLIIPHIRGLPIKEVLTPDKLGDDIMAMGHSALYKVSGTGSGRTIGGAKIEKVIKAENGLALVLAGMPESMPVPPMPEGSRKGSSGKKMHGGAIGSTWLGGGYEIEIDLGSDGKGSAYLEGLSGSYLRNGILSVYKQLFPSPLKWYQMFTSSFAMFTRYNSYDLMKYTGGVPPYYKWYSIFNRHPYVAAGGILMPYLSSGYAVDETILRRFIKSPWFAYRDPTVISISSKYLANGGEYDMEGGGPEDYYGGGLTIELERKRRGPAVLKYITQPVIVRLQKFSLGLGNYIGNLRILVQRLRSGAPNVLDLIKRQFKVQLKDATGKFEDLDENSDSSKLAKVQLYIDFLDYLLDKTSKLSADERRQIADEFLKSFEDVLKAIDGLNEENFNHFLGIHLKNYEALQTKMKEILDDPHTNMDWSESKDNIVAQLQGNKILKTKIATYLEDATGLDELLSEFEDKCIAILNAPNGDDTAIAAAANDLIASRVLSQIETHITGDAISQKVYDHLNRLFAELQTKMTSVSPASQSVINGIRGRVRNLIVKADGARKVPQFGGRKKKSSKKKPASKTTPKSASKPKKKRSASKKRASSKK